jgi:hypothetical protein
MNLKTYLQFISFRKIHQSLINFFVCLVVIYIKELENNIAEICLLKESFMATDEKRTIEAYFQ